jgi:hypothetical protein
MTQGKEHSGRCADKDGPFSQRPSISKPIGSMAMSIPDSRATGNRLGNGKVEILDQNRFESRRGLLQARDPDLVRCC